VIIGYHHVCKRLLKIFERGENVRSHVWYRWFNELPVIGMFAAVALVIIKPV
jgi:putative membrane protein